MKRYNRVFIIPLFQLESFRYSIIPVKKNYSVENIHLLHYSTPQHGIIPLFEQKISVIVSPLFLFTP